jgi:hypothetical protein
MMAVETAGPVLRAKEVVKVERTPEGIKITRKIDP